MQNQHAVNNLYEHIASAHFDQAVGIRLAYLTGDDHFSLYGAELSPHTKVGAHYHHAGIESYQIIEGTGIMYTGQPETDGQVRWNEPFIAKKGDCFTVAEGEVHQLFNESDEKLVVIFGCPKSHSTTDRILVKGVQEGE